MITRVLCTLIVMFAAVLPAAGDDRAVRYELGDRSDIRIVTEVVATQAGVRQWRHKLSAGSRAASVRAIDRATGRALSAQADGGELVVDLGAALPADAEQRIAIEEVAARADYVKGQGQGAKLVFQQAVQGRVTIVLPPGYTVTRCSVPAQFEIEAGRLKAGIAALEAPVSVVLEAEVGPSAPAAALSGSFRATDERTIVYWLEDPASQRIRLALEMLLTKPGQAHVYSVLRKEDNITEPVTFDVDRGRKLPTRIVTGAEATALGDAPAPFPADASVLVADLGYAVPSGGSARVRLHQVATDREGYEMTTRGELRWKRFLGRLRTRAVLPVGWFITSVDQPAAVSRDEQGRVVLDFTQTGADSPSLLLTARKADGGS
jgi:hypothetical protein